MEDIGGASLDVTPDVMRSSALVMESALSHVSLVIERLIFYSKNLGLLPRTSTASDPLGPIVVGDDDVAIITQAFRRVAQIPPRKRWQLIPDPLCDELDTSRRQLLEAARAPGAERFGLAAVVRTLELDGPILDAFLLALAPDLDARITRLLGYLNNDTTRQRPILAHLQMVLQPHLPAIDVGRLALLDERLTRTGLISVEKGSDGLFTNRPVAVPEYIVDLARRVLRPDETAPRALPWDELRWNPDDRDALAATLRRELDARTGAHRRLVFLEGAPGSGRCAAALAATLAAGVPASYCDLSAVMRRPDAPWERELSSALFRARVGGGALVVRSDGALKTAAGALHLLARVAEQLDVPCLVLVRFDELEQAEGLRYVRHEVPQLYATERRALWRDLLARAELRIDAACLDDISGRYHLTPGRVCDVSTELGMRSRWSGNPRVALEDVRAVLRDITSHRLRDLATRQESTLTIDDIVLPPYEADRLWEIVARLRHRYQVLDHWRFSSHNARGQGVSVLFAGPAGTGKTAAAVAIANELKIDLYVVDLSRVMSKWIGETEQNLARLFDEAESSSVALLFDEADSLFGKRSADVKSSSDRYANITVNYLLERIERFTGLAILTTNLESAIDQAFSRRLSARVQFPAPDRDHRLRLWQALKPATARYAADVDLGVLVDTFDMAGARIRNVILRAGFRTAAAGRTQPVLHQQDLLEAAWSEYEDMGRLRPRLPRESDDGPPTPPAAEWRPQRAGDGEAQGAASRPKRGTKKSAGAAREAAGAGAARRPQARPSARSRVDAEPAEVAARARTRERAPVTTSVTDARAEAEAAAPPATPGAATASESITGETAAESQGAAAATGDQATGAERATFTPPESGYPRHRILPDFPFPSRKR